jgi:hypothetical protein
MRDHDFENADELRLTIHKNANKVDRNFTKSYHKFREKLLNTLFFCRHL